MVFRGGRVFAVSAVLALVLGSVGWLDYRATARELRAALQSEAEALHATVAAAARVQHAAAGEAERALAQRLLEHGRLLAAMDERHGLDRTALESVASASDMFRVVVFDADGARSFVGGEPGPGAEPGLGGVGPGPGAGTGPGPGGRQGLGSGFGARDGRPGEGRGPRGGGPGVAQRLLAGEATEIVSAAHASRDGGERIAAGVRRKGGGAIVLNASNRVGRDLDAVYSLDALVTGITASTPAIAYVVLDDEGGRVARGPLAETADDPAVRARTLERAGTIPLDETRTTNLRIGMLLDEVIRAERRALLRIAGGLSAAGAVLLLAIAFGSLRHRYGDLSERHATAQEALRRRDRLAAMGELASTVAHEIRNPLNAIAMSAQRLAREYPVASLPEASRDDAAELVGVIQSEASRINGTVQQFLEFARPPALNLRQTSLAGLVDGIGQAAAALAATRGVKMMAEVADAPALNADPDQLRHAIDNLVRNAIDATPAGGTVTLRAIRRGASAIVEVEDTGAGIPEDVLPRVFDLYFTTKRDGTGVGLAVAQQVVTAHGGTIEVHSQVGRGTRMVIDLPQDGSAHV
jgi:signal transduction histidine kinase